MTERHDVTRATTMTPGRVTSRRAAVLAVTLIAASTLLAGCLIVPFENLLLRLLIAFRYA